MEAFFIVFIAMACVIGGTILKGVVSDKRKKDQHSNANEAQGFTPRTAKKNLPKADDVFELSQEPERKRNAEPSKQRQPQPRAQHAATTIQPRVRENTAHLQPRLQDPAKRIEPRVQSSVASRMVVSGIGHHDAERCTVEHKDVNRYRVEMRPEGTQSIAGKSEEGCQKHVGVRLVKLDEAQPAVAGLSRKEILSAIVLGDALQSPRTRRRNRR